MRDPLTSDPSEVALDRTIFRAYDIRGLVGDGINATVARGIGSAFVAYLREVADAAGALRVAVGHDSRSSSPALYDALVSGLQSAGTDVVALGLVPTPVSGFAADRWALDGAVTVTASHNPEQFNGFKLLERGAAPLLPEGIERVRDLAELGDFEDGAGSLEQREPLPEYLAMLEQRFRARRPLKVVVDPGNGVAALTGPRALERIGAEVVTIHGEIAEGFPNHLPDPQQADTMHDLARKVREERADLGIAWDGDGDRVGVVDQEGVRYEADWLTALLARPLLKREPGARILLDYKVSSSVIGNIAQHGGQPALTRTGYSTFRRHMRDEAIAFGGEASGHIVFGDGYQEGQDYPFIDDGVYAACALADYLSRDERPLSAHFADLRPMATSPELRLPCPDERKGPAADAVGEIFSEKNRLVSTADGARIEFDDGWALVRGSNTNPYLSVRFEAGTLEAYEQIRRELRDAIGRQEGVEISDDFGLPAAVGPQRLE